MELYCTANHSTCLHYYWSGHNLIAWDRGCLTWHRSNRDALAELLQVTSYPDVDLHRVWRATHAGKASKLGTIRVNRTQGAIPNVLDALACNDAKAING